MVFGMALEVVGQLSNPAGEEGDLHIRAAGIFLMELELLHVHRVTAFCHKRAGIVGEEWGLAREQFHSPDVPDHEQETPDRFLLPQGEG